MFILLLNLTFVLFLTLQPVMAADVIVLPDSDSATQVRNDMMITAENQLLTASYVSRPDDSMAFYINKLIDSAQRGVDTYYLGDWWGGRQVGNDVFQYMQDQGVHTRLFHPFSLSRSFYNRMHDKTVIKDNRVVLSGGRNYWNPSFGLGAHPHIDMEFLVDDGQVGQDAVDYFFKKWEQSVAPHSKLTPAKIATVEAFLETGKKIQDVQGFNPQILTGEVSVPNSIPVDAIRFVYDSAHLDGEDGPNTIDELISLINSAKKNIVIETPWIVLTPDVKAALKAARSRNVEISILTNSESSSERRDRYFVSRTISSKFLEKIGVKVFEYPNVSLHAKYTLIDGERGYMGTYNYGPRSERSNSEVGFIFESPELVQRMEEIFDTRVGSAIAAGPYSFKRDSGCFWPYYKVMGSQY